MAIKMIRFIEIIELQKQIGLVSLNLVELLILDNNFLNFFFFDKPLKAHLHGVLTPPGVGDFM